MSVSKRSNERTSVIDDPHSNQRFFCHCFELEDGTMTLMEISDYVTLVFTVPATHADAVRAAMGHAGAGRVGHYSHCSFSIRGIGRFMPTQGAKPFLGTEGILEEVIEERVETVCERRVLTQVLEAIKKAHPYEEFVIDIIPVFEMGRKKGRC
jgi:hypothetical protein